MGSMFQVSKKSIQGLSLELELQQGPWHNGGLCNVQLVQVHNQTNAFGRCGSILKMFWRSSMLQTTKSIRGKKISTNVHFHIAFNS
jgi:hypothetical protein